MTDQNRISDDQHNNAPVPEWDNKAYMTAIAGLRVKYGISHAMADLYYESWVELVRHSQKLEEQIARLNEHNNAPAVPQGDPTEEMLVAGLKECEPLGELIDWREGFGRIEMRAVWEAMLAATPAHAPAQGEPFGHFRAEPFGWTDCAEDDEGAIALYERPQEAGLPYRKEYASLPPMPWKRRNLGGLIEVVDANGNPVLPWLAFDAAAPGGRSTFKKRNAIALFIADMTSLYVDTPPATDAGVVEERFTKDVPTEQGWYWHWNGDEECRPLPTSVLWSGCTKSCFVSTGQLGLTQAVDCKEYGGYWLKMTEPWGAIDALRAKGGK